MKFLNLKKEAGWLAEKINQNHLWDKRAKPSESWMEFEKMVDEHPDVFHLSKGAVSFTNFRNHHKSTTLFADEKLVDIFSPHGFLFPLFETEDRIVYAIEMSGHLSVAIFNKKLVQMTIMSFFLFFQNEPFVEIDGKNKTIVYALESAVCRLLGSARESRPFYDKGLVDPIVESMC